MEPTIIEGGKFNDERGIITFNNDFNSLGIKRIYTIENKSTELIRGWQGHQIEQRWFSAILGSFTVKLIKVDSWKNPSKELSVLEFLLSSENLDVLHVPCGFISSIQALETKSKLLVYADYNLAEIQDEFRFPVDYFN